MSRSKKIWSIIKEEKKLLSIGKDTKATDDGINREGCLSKAIIIVNTHLEENMNLAKK